MLGNFEDGIFSKRVCLDCWEISVSLVLSELSDSSNSSDSDVECPTSVEGLVVWLPREMLSGAALVSEESNSLSSSVVHSQIHSKHVANESQK